MKTNFQIEIHCKKHSYLDIKIKEIDTKDIPDEYPHFSRSLQYCYMKQLYTGFTHELQESCQQTKVSDDKKTTSTAYQKQNLQPESISTRLQSNKNTNE